VFNEPDTHIQLYTEAGGELTGCDARVEVHRFAPRTLNFPGILAHLHAQHDVRGVTCEGGPHLLRELIVQDCLDDLILTISPLLVGGDALMTLAGAPLGELIHMSLRDVHRAGDHLFLHYTPQR
jgi:riboflavin biosynthesis pyrimidine reductase